jgi:hypothetical protein
VQDASFPDCTPQGKADVVNQSMRPGIVRASQE